QETVDRAPNVRAYTLEGTCLSAAISHSPVVEAHDREAAPREVARQQGELPVAAHPILGTTDNYEHPAPRRGRDAAQDRDQRFALAIECQGLLVDRHVKANQTHGNSLQRTAAGNRKNHRERYHAISVPALQAEFGRIEQSFALRDLEGRPERIAGNRRISHFQAGAPPDVEDAL